MHGAPQRVYYLLTFLSDLAVGLIATTYVLFLLQHNLDLFQVRIHTPGVQLHLGLISEKPAYLCKTSGIFIDPSAC